MYDCQQLNAASKGVTETNLGIYKPKYIIIDADKT